MPKTFPKEETDLILSLHNESKTNAEIVKIMAERYPDNWSKKSSPKTIRNIIERFENSIIEGTNILDKSLDEMTKDERFRFIEKRLESTPRYRMVFKSFNNEEKELFKEEYFNIIKSTESLTEVEEQVLFSSVLEFVLAMQALGRKEREEKYYEDSLKGLIKEGHPTFRRVIDDKYGKEYEAHMKTYQNGIQSLKMSRSQRLKEIKSQKISLVDLAEQLSNKNAQVEVADEITRLSKLRDEELKRMLDNGFLFGAFED